MAHDVFISYSSKDKIVANAVCATLEQRKIRCWIAPRDILPGDDWGEAIIDALTGCKIAVLVFSSGANESPQVKREVQIAFEEGAIVIPFRVEDVAPEKSLKFYMRSVHWLDALTQPMETHLEGLAEIVQLLLTRRTTEAGSASNTTKGFSSEIPSESIRNERVGAQANPPHMRQGKTPSQRDVMKELIFRHGLDRERVVREYVAMEQRGEVSRKRNASGLTAEGYARALWADGVKKHWLPGLD